ncbi:type II secretion system F family protein [Candidatus Omnitrophota bacterium]
MLLLIFGLVFTSAALLSWQLLPVGTKVVGAYQDKQVKRAAQQLDKLFLNVSTKKLLLVHLLVPLALGLAVFIFLKNILLVMLAAGLGVILPTIVIKIMGTMRVNKFSSQLVDGLMVLSSSLKGGLSLLQALEVLVEEMPEPISQEFSLVLRETQMGIPLDESLERLNKRIQSEELNLIITAIDIARETGGNLTEPFEKLMFTLRERDKLLGKVKTLTLQAKLQGVLMSLMPIVFAIVVFYTNPGFLQLMVSDPRGKLMLIVAGVLEIVGCFLLFKLSKVEV